MEIKSAPQAFYSGTNLNNSSPRYFFGYSQFFFLFCFISRSPLFLIIYLIFFCNFLSFFILFSSFHGCPNFLHWKNNRFFWVFLILIWWFSGLSRFTVSCLIFFSVCSQNTQYFLFTPPWGHSPSTPSPPVYSPGSKKGSLRLPRLFRPNTESPFANTSESETFFQSARFIRSKNLRPLKYSRFGTTK